MRLLRTLMLAAAALAFGAHAAAQSGPAGDADIARPGGVYSLLTAQSADACVQICAEDGLCIAWTYLPGGACELKAVAPQPVRSIGARSGLSARAPSALRHADADALSQLPAPPTLRPQVMAEFSTPLAAPAPDDSGLLGGVGEGDTPESLRPRLGSAGTW